ncbi:hypothetical protein HRM2_p00090 (plasmid) [Desulforapulum autotrophicum HRM2]|uniref:Uncharacterized protein n=1 Tax=Desulforapulum autotrophicum (strain ATCC 43914 / DSM 3382 / VKM B-1955 / HRM2) TaxID=177437 RepID=C0QMK9_DESAH|nr:hypothetical protein HRM2_p00090 [Desulforapulum autotrophicum HRM2]
MVLEFYFNILSTNIAAVILNILLIISKLDLNQLMIDDVLAYRLKGMLAYICLGIVSGLVFVINQ